jgi:hypothetical protein
VASALEQFQALNHEGDEALLGFDPPAPLVAVCPGLAEVKLAAHRRYCRRYGLPEALAPIVKRADLVLLATEKRDPNEKTERIAQSQLSAICHAIGRLNIEDSEQLHFQTLEITVSVEVDKRDEALPVEERRRQNRIKGYAPAPDATPGAAAPPRPQNSPLAASAVRPATAARPAAAPPRPTWDSWSKRSSISQFDVGTS